MIRTQLPPVDALRFDLAWQRVHHRPTTMVMEKLQDAVTRELSAYVKSRKARARAALRGLKEEQQGVLI